jgi:hypothetical protein
MNFKLPVNKTNDKGETRKAGFELEFTGIELLEIAKAVKKLFKGTIIEKSKYEYIVKDTSFGDFNIIIDADVLLNKAYEKYLGKAGINLDSYKIKPSVEDILNKLASTIVPFEIVTPPVELDKLYVLDQLSDELVNKGAQGTKASFLNAFGMHINAEVPSLNHEILLNYLRSFFLLFDYIYKKSEINFSRKLTPFIDNFPEEYVNLVLNPDYKPSEDMFINDYIVHNPTRNRAFDMLPVISMIDEKKVEKNVKDFKLVGKRPAFHYRLPNCNIGTDLWKPSDEWNIWYMIEELASDTQKIEKLSLLYLKTRKKLFYKSKWIEISKEFVNG